MGFGKDAFRNESEPRKSSFKDDLRKALKAEQSLKASEWIEKTGKSRLECSQKAIATYGCFVITDYVLFQVTPKDYCNTVSHRWDGQTLERLVARVYSDRPGGIVPVYEAGERARAEHEYELYETLSRGGMPLVGIATNIKCREKLPSSSWGTREVRNVVTCDIVLFKPIDTAFFNSGVLGSMGYDSYVDGDDCKLQFISTSNDVGTPCYVSASMANLQDKVKVQAEKIEELEKKSCKSNRQKRGCRRDFCDPVHCERECAFEEKACDVECDRICEEDDYKASDEAWRDGC